MFGSKIEVDDKCALRFLIVGGKRPGPTSFSVSLGNVKASFVFDATTGRLAYEAAIAGPSADVVGAAIHRGAEGETGSVVVGVLNAGGRSGSGDMILLPADREALVRDQG